MNNIFNQIGKFEISKAIFDDEQNLNMLFNLFSEFIIFKCEYDEVSNAFIYTTFHEKFDIINYGDTIPMYDISIESETNEIHINKLY